MLSRIIGDTEERKGEAVSMLCTAPLIRQLAVESYISEDEARKLLHHLAQDISPKVLPLLFTQEVAEKLHKLHFFDLVSIERLERVDNIAQMLFKDYAEKSSHPFDMESIANIAIDEPRAGYVFPDSKVGASVVETTSNCINSSIGRQALPFMATSLSPFFSLAIGAFTSRAACRFFNRPESNFALGVCNQLVNGMMAPSIAIVVSQGIRAYAGMKVNTTNESTMSIGSSLIFLTVSCLVFKGLAYSTARIYEAENRTKKSHKNDQEQETQNLYKY